YKTTVIEGDKITTTNVDNKSTVIEGDKITTNYVKVGDIVINNNKITNVQDGTADNDVVNVKQLNAKGIDHIEVAGVENKTNEGTVKLFRTAKDAETPVAVSGGIKFVAGGGTNVGTAEKPDYKDTFITISDGADKDSVSFTLDTGSKVVGNDTTSNTDAELLSYLTINGKTYKLAQGEGKPVIVNAGYNTKVVPSTKDGIEYFTVSVNDVISSGVPKKDSTALTALEDESTTPEPTTQYGWKLQRTVVEKDESGKNVEKTYYLADTNVVGKEKETLTIGKNTISIEDTAGNTVTYDGIASLDDLEEVEEDAKKHNTVVSKDGSVEVDDSGKNNNGGIEYKVSVNKNLKGMESIIFGEAQGDNVVYITNNGINAGNKVITHVGAGSIAEGSTDAVNGGQLWETNQDITNVKNAALSGVSISDPVKEKNTRTYTLSQKTVAESEKENENSRAVTSTPIGTIVDYDTVNTVSSTNGTIVVTHQDKEDGTGTNFAIDVDSDKIKNIVGEHSTLKLAEGEKNLTLDGKDDRNYVLGLSTDLNLKKITVDNSQGGTTVIEGDRITTTNVDGKTTVINGDTITTNNIIIPSDDPENPAITINKNEITFGEVEITNNKITINDKEVVTEDQLLHSGKITGYEVRGEGKENPKQLVTDIEFYTVDEDGQQNAEPSFVVKGIQDTQLDPGSSGALSKGNNTITIKDTAGKTVTYTGVASLEDVNEAKSEAAKHTTVFNQDGNILVEDQRTSETEA
ncbi:MAG: hypothetical protein HUJ56_08675, partial [Erysipelotrichaceae bacterium]|nr:hypothetical protein [Erysipelotrichaceae bacterium]